MAYINSIYNTGNDYPQLLYKWVHKYIPQVNIKLSEKLNILYILSTGDISYIDHYKMSLFSNGVLISNYIIPGTDTQYDLTEIGKTIDAKEYEIEVTAYTSNNVKISESIQINWYNTASFTIIGTTVNGITLPLAAGNKILKI